MEKHFPLFVRIGALLSNAEHVLLLNPEKGDGDSLGSTLAIANHLAQTKRPYTVFAKNAKPGKYSYLPRYEEIVSDPDQLDLEKFDVIINIDFADPKMTGIFERLKQLDSRRTTIVNIDHHPMRVDFGDVNLIDENRAAACELVFGLFEHQQWHMDRHIATCLLTGILTDTGMFANRNTTPHSLSIAATLLRRGARMRTIYDFTYRNKTVGVLKLWGIALSRLQKNQETGIVTTYIQQEDLITCGVEEDAVEGIANFLNKLGEASAILVLHETTGDRVKGSFRTTGDTLDVAALAAKYGGGGHRRAAGFVVPGRLQKENGAWNIVPQS